MSRASLPRMTNDYTNFPPPSDEDDATPESTRMDLLGGQTRYGPPIRHTFLQEFGNERSPGPLHKFVEERRLFALQLLLLLHCLPLRAPWSTAHPAGVWARALGKTGPGGEGAVSRNWRWLAEQNLVCTEPFARKVRVYLLNEDGSGEKYTRSKSFFYFPRAFFLEGWHERLGMRATVVLLVALSRTRKSPNAPWFELRTELQAKWYGVSPDTLQRGVDELQDAGLLQVHTRRVRDNRARYGIRLVNEYMLIGDLAAKEAVRDVTEEDAS